MIFLGVGCSKTWWLIALGIHAVLISCGSPNVPQRCQGSASCEPFLRLVRAVPTPLKLSTFGGVRDTTSCTRVHAEQESQLNGGSEATFAYSRHFGKISRVFFHTSREISNLPPNSGCEKWCEILRENLERPVRIFQKWLFPTRNALLKLFS